MAVNTTMMEEVVMMKNKATLSRAVNMSIVAPNKTVSMGTTHIQLVMIVLKRLMGTVKIIAAHIKSMKVRSRVEA